MADEKNEISTPFRLETGGNFGTSIMIDMPTGCDMVIVCADTNQHVPVWIGLPHQFYVHTAYELMLKHQTVKLTVMPYSNAAKVSITHSELSVAIQAKAGA